MSVTVYCCLGSNICPQDNISFAVRRVQRDFDQVVTSNLYRSKAVGFEGDDFLNLVLSIQTDLSLTEILQYADRLEQEAGRVRVRRGRFDSRTLDVDVLMYGDLSGQHAGRDWPSADLDDNAHVLLPMSEIAGDVPHPSSGVKFEQLWQNFELKDQALRREQETW
ncbi:MAG: 2-amino-4-hydroxy-6-hydroxymethyldihydropteridine diphosphokinase [Pseudomonadota bacterium]